MSGILVQQHKLQKYIKPPVTGDNDDRVKALEELIAEPDIKIEAVARQQLLQERATLLFSTLDLSFLTMRGKKIKMYQGDSLWRSVFGVVLPGFAVYRLDSPYFEMVGRYEAHWDGSTKSNFIGVETELHEAIASHLCDACDWSYKRGERSDGEIEYTWNARVVFSGLVPKEVKQLIKREEQYFEFLCMVTEAIDWTLRYSSRVVPSSGSGGGASDPLLIGGISDQFYLLAEFNCTDIENYVAREFTTKPIKEVRNGFNSQVFN